MTETTQARELQSREIDGATIEAQNAGAAGEVPAAGRKQHIAVYVTPASLGLLAAIVAAVGASAEHRVEERNGLGFDARETAPADVIVVPADEAFARAAADAYAQRGCDVFPVPHDAAAFATSPIAASLAEKIGAAAEAFVFPSVEGAAGAEVPNETVPPVTPVRAPRARAKAPTPDTPVIPPVETAPETPAVPVVPVVVAPGTPAVTE